MEIFRCLAGSRLYGVSNENSDYDFKAVHLPTKRQILLGKRDQVISTSTGPKDARNSAGDTDTESFELQRFLKLASDMQTIPVEMLFVNGNDIWTPLWYEVVKNRDKILNRNAKAFVGYCKGQAVRYSMRGNRLETYEEVVKVLAAAPPSSVVGGRFTLLSAIEGVKIVTKDHNGKQVLYLDVFGRQVPEGVEAGEAVEVYRKPVREAGNRARAAKESGGMDNKALYHAMRIVDEGIELFETGNITFPCQNLDFLRQIRAGEVDLDRILDQFDEKIAILEAIGDESPLAERPDKEWTDDFVASVYEATVRG